MCAIGWGKCSRQRGRDFWERVHSGEEGNSCRRDVVDWYMTGNGKLKDLSCRFCIRVPQRRIELQMGRVRAVVNDGINLVENLVCFSFR
jgi:hypothetical protein